MSREQFIFCMQVVHDALYKVHRSDINEEHERIMDLINTYISMMAGFHEPLYEALFNFLLSHQTVTEKDLDEFYTMLTVEPDQPSEALQ